MGPVASDLGDLAQRVIARAGDAPRILVAIAGPPGAGKTRLTDELAAAIEAAGVPVGQAPMDGFHFDNRILAERGDLARKGAPFTFDVAGYLALLTRLRRTSGAAVVVPVFDRGLDLARAGAAIVAASARIVLCEGNYLLVEDEPWNGLAPCFDLTIRIEAERAVLERRLIQRWLDHGLDRTSAEKRARANDLANAAFVEAHSRPADIIWRS